MSNRIDPVWLTMLVNVLFYTLSTCSSLLLSPRLFRSIGRSTTSLRTAASLDYDLSTFTFLISSF